MSSDLLVPALFLMTFAVAIAFGIYQWRKARKARKAHKRTSIGELPPTPASADAHVAHGQPAPASRR